MTTPWRTIRVFISSTFKDMQAERDHLVRFVFPRLREELLQRRIQLVDVDLRWGVTSDQDASEVCREIVDECHPRFLCMLGGRYGWTPPGKDHSITADEVHYGVLDRIGQHGHAFFYFRDPGATAAMVEERAGEFREPPGSPNEHKLAELKEVIDSLGLRPFTYPAIWDRQQRRLAGLTGFGQRVYADLRASVEAEFGTQAASKLDEFAEENAAMEAFAEERSQRFVLGSRETIWNDLLRHAEGTGGNGSLCLIGDPGSGKSALLAKFAQALQKPASFLVVVHFVGASPSSSNARRTLRRLCHELVQGAGLTAEIPDNPEKLPTAFLEVLKQASAKTRVVLLVDAVNQFDPGSSDLNWLPEELPDNARIILSTLPGAALDDLRRRLTPPTEVTLPPLAAGDADLIVDEFLLRYRKSVTAEQRAMLRVKADAVTPLYLLAALEELRTLGTYEEITGRIRELPGTTQALFVWILKRLENDPGFRDAVGRLVGAKLAGGFSAYLAASQHGLSQSELIDLLDQADPQGNVAALLQLLRPYLMRRGELLDFYHGQFRSAAEQAYLRTEAQRKEAHEVLADYFRGRADPGGDQRWEGKGARPFVELPFHLAQSDAGKLHELLWNPHWHRAKLKHTDVYGLIGDMAMIPQDRELRLVQQAVYLSAHVLVRDRAQFSSQLVGRLLACEEPAIQSLLKEIAKTQDGLWLRSTKPALQSPGTPLVRTLEGHSDFVLGAALSRDGRRVVSASGDKTLKVWDLGTGRELRTLEGHSDSVMAVAVTPDGQRAVSASSDKTLKVWDLETGRELRTLEGHSRWVSGVAVTPDGRRAVSASGDKTVTVWDLETGSELLTLQGHTHWVNAVAVTPDGQRVVSGSNDKTLKVWELETGKELRSLEGHSDSVLGVAMSPNGRRAVSASGNTLKVWELETGREVRALEGHSDAISGVAMSRDGRWAVSGSRDKTLKVWAVETGREFRTFEGHSGAVACVALTPDGRRAVSASENTLKVWDPETGHELRTLGTHADSVAVRSDGRLAVSACYDKVKVWDLETGRELYTLEGHASWAGLVRGVAVSPDGQRAASASYDKTLKVWDLETGRELRTLEGHSEWVLGVAVSPDGQRAASASRDKTLKVWDLKTWRDLRTLQGHTRDINGVAMSPDGSRAVSASDDHTLKVWDLETGTALATFTCDAEVRSCGYALGGRLIAGDALGRVYFLCLEDSKGPSVDAEGPHPGIDCGSRKL